VFRAASHRKIVSQSFADAFDPRQNAFNFLRLVLALLVIVGHCFPLGGFGPERPIPALTGGQYSLGTLSVGMFFLLSGFLISRSASGELSVGRFIWHRFLRIFPGYWACLLVTAFVFAPIFCAIEHGAFFDVFAAASRHTPQSYVLDNATMFSPRGFTMKSVMAVSSGHMVGLLGHNPIPWTVNGSLWSLPVELICYAAVAVLASFGIMRQRRSVVLALFALFLAIREFNFLSAAPFLDHSPSEGFQTLSFFCFYFFAGSFCFLYREKIPYSKGLLCASTCLGALGLTIAPLGFLVPITLPYSFLCLSFKLPVARFTRKSDYSYGTYIYAFPVQQGLALLGVQKAGFALYLISTLLVTGVLAFLSYRCVEAPCLRWKNWDWGAAWRARSSPAADPAFAVVPAKDC
jgi:peptidoglycan/LPS O-acetylase OafA/YrhL